MSLPVRPHRGTAPNVEGNEFTYDVVAGDAPDPHLEFPPEQGHERHRPQHHEPVFVIEPASHVQRQAQPQDVDQELVPSDLELFRDAVKNVVPHWERPRFVPVLALRTLLSAAGRRIGATLVMARHVAAWAFVALCFSVIGAYGAALRMTSRLAQWTSRSGARVLGAFTSAGVAGMSWLRSLPTPRVRARLNRDLDEVHISLRLPAPNRTLMVFTGGIAVGAIVMWLASVPSAPAGSPDSAVPLASAAVAPGPTANDAGAAVYTAVPVTMPISGELQPLSGQRETAPAPSSPVAMPTVVESPATSVTPTPPSVEAPGSGVTPTPTVIESPAITVTSMPAGARVTVDGIGWGETPVTIHYLPPGQKVVRISKEGYESEQRIISVPDDPRSAAVRVALRTR